MLKRFDKYFTPIDIKKRGSGNWATNLGCLDSLILEFLPTSLRIVEPGKTLGLLNTNSSGYSLRPA